MPGLREGGPGLLWGELGPELGRAALFWAQEAAATGVLP